jgi:glycosyltransferase involved in cell wall biosynthesis
MTRGEPIVIASLARVQGSTGVHTHVNQLRGFLARSHCDVRQVTPHSWAGRSPVRRLTLGALFGVRPLLERVYGPAHVWWYRASHEWFLQRALRKRLAELGPCVVYAQCPPSAHAALKARTGPGQRVVLAVHFRISQSDEWADKGHIRREGRLYRSIRQFERRTVPAVDGLVFVSSWARSALCAWMPEVAAAPGVVIPNFVQAVPAAAVAPRGDLVSVGSLEAIKNHRYLFRVLAAARERGRRYTLDVFGEGVERGNLLTLADELGVAGQVRLCGFRRDVPGLLPGYRLYVHASYSESSSLAIMEAMAAGLPVISSAAGPLPELFEEPEHGRFWPLDNPPRGAEILIDLLESEQELRRAGRAALKKFRTDYDVEIVAPRLVSFLRSAPDISNDDPSPRAITTSDLPSTSAGRRRTRATRPRVGAIRVDLPGEKRLRGKLT